MTPAEIIRTRRAALAMSQRQLAELVGVDVGSVRRWEAGGTRPRNHNLLRLCRVLGVDPKAFVA